MHICGHLNSALVLIKGTSKHQSANGHSFIPCRNGGAGSRDFPDTPREINAVQRYRRGQWRCPKLLVIYMEPHPSKTVHFFFKQSNSTHVLVSQLMIPVYLFFFPLSRGWLEIYLSNTKHGRYKKVIFGTILCFSCWIFPWIYHMFQCFLFSLHFGCLTWTSPRVCLQVLVGLAIEMRLGIKYMCRCSTRFFFLVAVFLS